MDTPSFLFFEMLPNFRQFSSFSPVSCIKSSCYKRSTLRNSKNCPCETGRPLSRTRWWESNKASKQIICIFFSCYSKSRFSSNSFIPFRIVRADPSCLWAERPSPAEVKKEPDYRTRGRRDSVLELIDYRWASRRARTLNPPKGRATACPTQPTNVRNRPQTSAGLGPLYRLIPAGKHLGNHQVNNETQEVTDHCRSAQNKSTERPATVVSPEGSVLSDCVSHVAQIRFLFSWCERHKSRRIRFFSILIWVTSVRDHKSDTDQISVKSE